MRGYVLFCVVLAVLAAVPFEAKAVSANLLQEDFETETNFVRSTAGTNNEAANCYFKPTQTLGGFVGAVGPGAWYYVGEDLNGMVGHVAYDDTGTTFLPGAAVYTNHSAKGALTFPTINISGCTDIQVALLVAASTSNPTVAGFDLSQTNGDELSVQASIDSSAFVEVGRFQSTISNGDLREWVSGTIIGSTFSDWTFDVAGTGSTLDLRVVMRATTPLSSEVIAFDNLRVTATVPEPSTITLLVAGLIGLFAYAWRKRQ
jgi:hypothetical protein